MRTFKRLPPPGEGGGRRLRKADVRIDFRDRLPSLGNDPEAGEYVAAFGRAMVHEIVVSQ
jgi:hypothetical protein